LEQKLGLNEQGDRQIAQLYGGEISGTRRGRRGSGHVRAYGEAASRESSAQRKGELTLKKKKKGEGGMGLGKATQEGVRGGPKSVW